MLAFQGRAAAERFSARSLRATRATFAFVCNFFHFSRFFFFIFQDNPAQSAECRGFLVLDFFFFGVPGCSAGGFVVCCIRVCVSICLFSGTRGREKRDSILFAYWCSARGWDIAISLPRCFSDTLLYGKVGRDILKCFYRGREQGWTVDSVLACYRRRQSFACVPLPRLAHIAPSRPVSSPHTCI